MRFCFYTNSISPHQLPLARELAKRLGVDNYRYVTQNRVSESRLRCGWADEEEPWIVSDSKQPQKVRSMLNSCDVLMCGVRDFTLFELRAQRGLPTLYASERWFKPIHLQVPFNIRLPGRLRLIYPSYSKMAHRIRCLLRSDAPFFALPFGVHAAADMAYIAGWDRPVFSSNTPGTVYKKLRLWGYFVSPSTCLRQSCCHDDEPLKILWVGRMLGLKGVDVIIKSVRCLTRERVAVSLTLVGDGPERARLVHLAHGLPVEFMPPQSVARIREIMREHDVFVFASNAEDGWGAVVNEALEEGMRVLGTFEPGASATMLEEKYLFPAGDSKRLSKLLMHCVNEKRAGTLKGQGIGEWSVTKAADRLLSIS